MHNANMDALNQLHSILSPAERAALIEKVRAHWEVWRRVNADDDQGHLQHLTRGLDLNQDQVNRIAQALQANAPQRHDPSMVESHVQAFETAFAGDNFDARSMPMGGGDRSRVGAPLQRMVHFYVVVTPILTPEQRTALAGRLRDRANDVPPQVSSEVRP
jgi:Spy/CpxP family protein refolding chaperone